MIHTLELAAMIVALVVHAGPFSSIEACEAAKPAVEAPIARYECVVLAKPETAPPTAPMPRERPGR